MVLDLEESLLYSDVEQMLYEQRMERQAKTGAAVRAAVLRRAKRLRADKQRREAERMSKLSFMSVPGIGMNGGGGGGGILQTLITEGSKLAQIVLTKGPSIQPPAPAQAAQPGLTAASMPQRILPGVVTTAAGAIIKSIPAVGGALAQFCKTNPTLCGMVGGAIGGVVLEKGADLLGFGGAKPRRRRRMNSLNPRALRRSIRRLDSFRCFAQKVMSVRPAFRQPARRCKKCA